MSRALLYLRENPLEDKFKFYIQTIVVFIKIRETEKLRKINKKQ